MIDSQSACARVRGELGTGHLGCFRLEAVLPQAGDRLASALVRALGALPRSVQRRLAGTPRRIDGQELDLELQMMLRLMDLVPGPEFEELAPAAARRMLDREAVVFGARRGVAMRRVRELSIPGPGGEIGARLYVPSGASDPSPLIVWFHGGGFVIGGHGTHDQPCRFLAHEACVRVLSVEYRLAPESRYPAAVEDAFAALRFAAAEAPALGAEAERLGVGGDSAGGNLAAVCSLLARDHGLRLAFQLLLFPWVDLTRKARSYELFGDDFFLTESQLDWYRAHYLDTARIGDWAAAGAEPAGEWRASPLHARDLAGVAPAHVAVAGFDPLRDEGIAYAHRLREAGVPATLRVHRRLTHSFVNACAVGRACPAGSREVAAALRAGLHP